MNNNELLEQAKEAMGYSYSPYSHFAVGAALLTEDDHVYTGCNIENASYGATNCAERTAMYKAVSEGHIRFKKLAIVSSSGDKTFPCGICRQVMAEFMDKDSMIVLEDSNGIYEYSLSELLPNVFHN